MQVYELKLKEFGFYVELWVDSDFMVIQDDKIFENFVYEMDFKIIEQCCYGRFLFVEEYIIVVKCQLI